MIGYWWAKTSMRIIIHRWLGHTYLASLWRITMATQPTKNAIWNPRLLQSCDRLGRRGDMTNDSAEILFQSFLPREAIVSSSGMNRDVHSFMLAIQHVLCRPRRRPKVPRRVVLERLSWRIACRTMPVSESKQLPEEVPMGPQRSWFMISTNTIIIAITTDCILGLLYMYTFFFFIFKAKPAFAKSTANIKKNKIKKIKKTLPQCALI